jgi:hypothetical protein
VRPAIGLRRPEEDQYHPHVVVANRDGGPLSDDQRSSSRPAARLTSTGVAGRPDEHTPPPTCAPSPRASASDRGAGPPAPPGRWLGSGADRRDSPNGDDLWNKDRLASTRCARRSPRWTGWDLREAHNQVFEERLVGDPAAVAEATRARPG